MTAATASRRFRIEQRDDDWHVWIHLGHGWLWRVYVSLDDALAAIKEQCA